jgi:hypothetical protein
MLAGVVVASLGTVVASAAAAPTHLVDLGRAGTYAVLTGASVGNTVSAVGAPHTTLRGDLGIKASTQPTGFPPGVVTGATHVGNAAAAGAHAHLVGAYDEVAGRPGGTPLAGDLAGVTLAPGLHSTPAAVANTGTVTLDAGGDPDAVFVMKVGGALTMAAGAQVTLAGQARASRVFWQVGGAAAVGAGGRFAGTLMALDAVAMGAGTQVNGRAMSRNGAISLDANEFYSAPPVVTLDGGPVATTTDTTPTISGTTDQPGVDAVTVTVAGQTLVATASEEAWSVTSGLLANDTYPVVASVTDGSGNRSSATQALTVDTVLPVVTLDGGPSAVTNDPTPTLAGTSDVAPGSVVRVSAGGQTLSALVQPAGGWNVTPAALGDGTHTVTASVTDPAGNPGTDSQALTVDTVAPAITIAGGASALTRYATPVIAGTADVPPGTSVEVTVDGEPSTTSVGAGGAWSITAPELHDGRHRVVVSASDPAGNAAVARQTLSVDTAAPRVTIAGGASRTTGDVEPTIVGTSDAAPGTAVTVSIAGRTMTTLLQPDGTWNVTPTAVDEGTWPVRAEVADAAGNVGSAEQALTVAVARPVTPPAPPPAGTPPAAEPPAPAPTPPAPDPPVLAPEPPAPAMPSAPAPAATPPAPAAAPLSGAAAGAVVAGDATQRLRGPSISIGTKVSAPAGRVVATTTGTVRIAGSRRPIRLTSARATIAAGAGATLRSRPSGSPRAASAARARIVRAARSGRRVTATITTRLVDAAGRVRITRRVVTLTA